MNRLLLLFLLSGCVSQTAYPAIVINSPPCAPPVSAPLPPPKPRSVEGIAAWGNSTVRALEKANARLVECEQRRASILHTVEAK